MRSLPTAANVQPYVDDEKRERNTQMHLQYACPIHRLERIWLDNDSESISIQMTSHWMHSKYQQQQDSCASAVIAVIMLDTI